MRLVNTTIARNTSADRTGGGGISTDVPMQSDNTLIAENTGMDCRVTAPITGDANLTSDTSCYLRGYANLQNAFPGFGSFGAHGNGTPYFPLTKRSPAVGAGSLRHCPEADQKYALRHVDGSCDIGAVEFDPAARP